MLAGCRDSSVVDKVDASDPSALDMEGTGHCCYCNILVVPQVAQNSAVDSSEDIG